jgi:NDP-sugar pyrophosphorylase family protein
MVSGRFDCVPVVDERRYVKTLLFKNDLFEDHPTSRALLPLHVPVVIMAGGKGTRLAPFTNVLPKPLIPVGDKTILETIIEKFLPYQVTEFYITVNHKAGIIRSYFDDLDPAYTVHFVEEPVPTGTAGGLLLLRERIGERLLVTNCDIIVDTEYSDIETIHRTERNTITLVTSVKRFSIPYGVCSVENGTGLVSIVEKPNYDLLVNTGMYIVEASALDLIPPSTMFHMTDLVEAVKKQGMRVGVYPISEDKWIDVGEWDAYKSSLRKLGV